MAGKDTLYPVFVDFIPTCPGYFILLGCHVQWMQIAGEGISLVKDQRNAVITMPRRVNDLSRDAKVCKKFSALFDFQDETAVQYDFNVRVFLFSKNSVSWVIWPVWQSGRINLVPKFFNSCARPA